MRSGPHCPMSFLFNRVLLKMGLECGTRTPLAERSEKKPQVAHFVNWGFACEEKKDALQPPRERAHMPHSTCFLNRILNVPPS